ncbi:uncharacterized protein LOC143343893 [Colletes latitarsis]|uniref:uncharacterized protein LOC143343893 n=1 Tax=Colletes latitarsis TaxID=2605962 RepID=UPI004036838A
MIESKYQTSPDTAVKKHRGKLKTYWCAPRKVRSIKSSSNQLTKTEKPKKRRRKKTRNLKRDILGQSKSGKFQSKQNHRSANVMESNRKCKIGKSCSTAKGKSTVYPRKSLCANSLVTNYTTKSKIRNSSAIVLPKKLGVRLFSLVTKRLKELTNSGNIV